jgi:DNA topoisomerase IA
VNDSPARYGRRVQLVIAEKPAVARDLARVLGVRPSGQHGFEGEHCVITWCIGHLVELDEPAAYDARWKAWRLDTLPMVPATFRLRPARHAAAQLRAVARLLCDRRFRAVVNACDAGREGELIFRYVYQFAGGNLPIRRLWISSLTDDAIRRGFAALRPGAQLDALADAARSRSEADWLVGMNATRAITARGRAGGHTALYSIGRVQTPTLAMLVSREHAIRAFVPRSYWEIRGTFTATDGQRFTAGWRHGAVARLATAELAGAIVARDAAHAAAADPLGPRVERLRARTVREPPPLLFDLTSLQRTANRRFGFSAARTLDLAQALYERHKVLTYPRTDARHLTSDVARELPALFATLAAVPDYAAFAAELVARPPRPGRRVIDDSKVHDHHAIIPSGKPVHLEALDRDERRLFDLVARRFLAAFFPDAEFAITEAWIRVGPARAGAPAPAFASDDRPPPSGGSEPARSPVPDGEQAMLADLPAPPDRYLARGRVRLAAGWQAVAGIDGTSAARDRSDPDAEPAQGLPPLVEGQRLVRADRPADHTAAALHRGDPARRHGVGRHVDRRRRPAARHEGLRPRHAGDPRGDHRDPPQARLHRAHAAAARADAARHRADRRPARRQPRVARAHRQLGGAPGADRPRRGLARGVHDRHRALRHRDRRRDPRLRSTCRSTCHSRQPDRTCRPPEPPRRPTATRCAPACTPRRSSSSCDPRRERAADRTTAARRVAGHRR